MDIYGTEVSEVPKFVNDYRSFYRFIVKHYRVEEPQPLVVNNTIYYTLRKSNIKSKQRLAVIHNILNDIEFKVSDSLEFKVINYKRVSDNVSMKKKTLEELIWEGI